MDQTLILYTILGMALVTYLPRLLPLWMLNGRTLPPLVTTWLRYVPVAVLAAMLSPALLIPDDRIQISLDNLFLLAAIPTTLVAWRTRSLFWSVITGMVCVALGRLALF
ncbi:MAG: AzlD domain-containing protein [Anaerolineaceae bacterium]|nr:AzlD domain-containing protein [Anaerolineaceae bacterium]